MSAGSEGLFFERISRGDREAVRQMLQENPGRIRLRTPQGVSPMMLALYHQEPQLAEMLRGYVTELDIFEAAAIGDTERMRVLLDGDPSVINAFSADGFQPLGLACFFRREAAAEMLLSRGAQVNSPSRNAQRVMPLHSAVAARQAAIVQRLLAAGADPNAPQAKGFRPLHAAAQHGDEELIRLLLQAGADPGATTEDGRTPRDMAMDAGHQAIAQRLSP